MRGDTLFGNLFLSAGAMKAGTTWLYSVLAQHPELHFTPEKEIHYFYHKYVNPRQLSDSYRLREAKQRHLGNFDPKRANPDRIRLNLHWVANYLSRPVDDLWYRNLFTYPRKETWGCDFSNLYAHLPAEAWPKIAADCERLKVIYTLRHPLKRLWSHVKFHLQVMGQVEHLDVWGPGDFKSFAKRTAIWENAEYGQVVRRLRAGLPPENLKILFFEDMRQDPRGILRGIEDFLEISHHDYPASVIDRRVNESVSRPMPDFFPALFAPEISRICNELGAQGLVLPESWQVSEPV